MFEQSIFIEAPLFAGIPLLNQISVLDGATFRAGYTFLWANHVARPGNSVVYSGFPMSPAIGVNRTRFWTQNVSLGVEWPY